MSLHLEGMVRMREGLFVHSVSHLVSMVSYMYVIKERHQEELNTS